MGIQQLKFKPRALFNEIICGYSLIYWREKPVYFKHFTNCEIGRFEIEEEKDYEEAHSKGLPTEQEKIELLKNDGVWTEAQEREIKQEKDFLEGQITTKKNLLLESQIKQVNKLIEESQEKVNKLLSNRASLVGYVVEGYIARKMNEKNILNATFQDSELKIPLFSLEEFNELEDSDLEELIIIYNSRLEYINKTLKRLAVSAFFQNLFYLSKESGIYNFYGKPVVQLSIFQIDIYIYANFFSNILNGETKPTQEMLDNPDLIIEAHQKNSNMKGAIGEQKTDLSGGSIIGGKKKDYEEAGIKGRFINFRSKLKEGQTELSSVELANIFNSPSN